MQNIDVFAATLFEEAKRYLEKAEDCRDEQGKIAYLHAALLLGISSLEAHINAISKEMATRSGCGIMDQSILTEKDITFDKGEFLLANKLKIYGLTDRIQFLAKRFGLKGKNLDTNSDSWSKLHQCIDERNSLVHPKEVHYIDINHVKDGFEGIIGTLDSLYMTLYNQHFPALGRNLDSKMSF